MLARAMDERPPRILILSASIGEGHDLPARALAAGIVDERPDAHVEIADALEIAGERVRDMVRGDRSFTRAPATLSSTSSSR